MTGLDGIYGAFDPSRRAQGLPRPHLIGEAMVDQSRGFGQGPEGTKEGESGLPDFGQTLTDALMEVRSLSKDSKAKAEALGRGEPVEIHDVMIAGSKSEVAFTLMLEVRNKLLEVWQKLKSSVV